MTTQAPDAPRLFDLLEGVADAWDAAGRKAEADDLRAFFARGTGGAEIDDLIQRLAASPAVQPAAGMVFGPDEATLSSLWDTLEMCERGEGHQPGVVTVQTDTFRDILAAISTPAQASGEPFMWVTRLDHTCEWAQTSDPDYWRRLGGQVQPLYAHPPAQGGAVERLREALSHAVGLLPGLAGAAHKPDNTVYTVMATKGEILKARAMLAALSAPGAGEGVGK